MKFKKLASLLIAGAMVFSMAMPAFAGFVPGGGTLSTTGGTDATTGGSTGSNQPSDLARSLKFTGTTSVPTINVDMATDAAIILNPYGLTVTVGGEESTDPFLTETIIITNHSNCPIGISGSFTPVVAGDVKLVANAAAADSGKNDALVDKNVFVTVVMGHVTKDDSVIDFSATSGDYRTKVKAATGTNKFSSDWLATNSGGKQGYYPLTTADTAVNFGDANDSASGKVPYVLKAGNDDPTYFGLRMFGLCEKWVKEAWTASDTVSVNMAMSIAPASN